MDIVIKPSVEGVDADKVMTPLREMVSDESKIIGALAEIQTTRPPVLKLGAGVNCTVEYAPLSPEMQETQELLVELLRRQRDWVSKANRIPNHLLESRPKT